MMCTIVAGSLVGIQTNRLDLTLLSLFVLSPFLSLTCWAGLRKMWGSTHKLQCWELSWRLAKTSIPWAPENIHTPIISSYMTFNLPPYLYLCLLHAFATTLYTGYCIRDIFKKLAHYVDEAKLANNLLPSHEISWKDCTLTAFCVRIEYLLFINALISSCLLASPIVHVHPIWGW